MRTIWFHYAIPISKLKEDACLYTTRTKPYRLRRDFLIINTVSAGTCSKKNLQYAYRLRKDGYTMSYFVYSYHLYRLHRDILQHLFITQSPQGQFKTSIYNAVSAGTISTFIYNAVSAGTIYNIYL